MIKLKDLICEVKNVVYPYGCIMAYINNEDKQKILKFNKELIDNDIIYNNKKKEFGRELEPHVTIKYGLTETYTWEEMNIMVGDISPFTIILEKTSIFQNEEYDVIKINADGKELKQLNKKFCKLPNEDKYLEYHPHCTLAYVKKGEGTKFKNKGEEMSCLINEIVYSDNGKKYYYKLKDKKK